MTLQEFIAKYSNQYVEAGGSPQALNQCVDLVNQYIEEVLGGEKILGTNAVDFPIKAGNRYEWIVNDEITDLPVKGDIIIWGNGYGHIAIFVEGDTRRFKSFDQNWPLGSKAHIQEHDYTNVIGWLRWKNAVVPNITKWVISEGLYNFLFVENNFSEGNIREGMGIFKSGVVGEYERKINELNEKVKNLEAGIIEINQGCEVKINEAINLALIEPNKIIESQKIKIVELSKDLGKWQELSENGIGLIFRGLEIFLKGFIKPSETVKSDGKEGETKN